MSLGSLPWAPPQAERVRAPHGDALHAASHSTAHPSTVCLLLTDILVLLGAGVFPTAYIAGGHGDHCVVCEDTGWLCGSRALRGGCLAVGEPCCSPLHSCDPFSKHLPLSTDGVEEEGEVRGEELSGTVRTECGLVGVAGASS